MAWSRGASAQAGPPGGHDDTAFDLMNVLTKQGLHDIDDEGWNLYGQFTYISSWKPPFAAPYSNAGGSTNSLLPGAERSFTGSFTLFFGVALWPGGEAYFVPEVIAERPLSQLRGLGGAVQNFELQKTGAATPQIYRSRAFVRETIGLGGKAEEKTSDPMQLGSKVDARRLVLTAGNFSVLDVFDRNTVVPDPRQDFLNMDFMTYAAYDFASDARGYGWGAAAEFYDDDWVIRLGRMTQPQNPNQLETDFRVYKYYGDQAEVEHKHTIAGKEGAVRVLGYRNRVNAGRFDDALAAFASDPAKNATTCTGFSYGSGNAHAPDLCWARKPTVKAGIGIDIEQRITEDLGVFARGMISDGQTEVYAYTSTDRSLSLGALARGRWWGRHFDLAGVGLGLGWVSREHAEYLRLGGIDGFIGDGAIKQAAETAFEAFYSFNLLRAIWLTADYQHIANPAFNADRGPVNVIGARVHVEF